LNKTLRVGIIGLGVGEAHIAGFELDPRCRVTALCDFDPSKRSVVRAKYKGCRIYSTFDELIADKDIDVVSIASYDNFHAEQLLRCLTEGKHVFVEKPLCITEQELEKINESHLMYPELQIGMNYILRYYPRFQSLKERIVRNDMGSIYYVEGDYDYGRIEKINDGWRGQIENYSVTLGGAIHLVDLLCWLINGKVTEVYAAGNKFFTPNIPFYGNDLVAAILKFENGEIGKISANFGSVTPHHHRLAVYGTQGSFHQSHDGARYIFSRQGDENELLSDNYSATKKGDLLPHFIKTIMDGLKPKISFEETVSTMAVCFAIDRSLRSGAVEKVRYFDSK
jgi:predicted dehydrogenase